VKRILAGLAGTCLLALLAACASAPDGSVPATPKPHMPLPAKSSIAEPPPLPQSASPAAPAAVLKPMANDQCGAQALQYLIGKPRTDIPVPLDPAMRRVVCSSCVVTQDFRADRQTIVFNSDTGLITSVKCG